MELKMMDRADLEKAYVDAIGEIADLKKICDRMQYQAMQWRKLCEEMFDEIKRLRAETELIISGNQENETGENDGSDKVSDLRA